MCLVRASLGVRDVVRSGRESQRRVAVRRQIECKDLCFRSVEREMKSGESIQSADLENATCPKGNRDQAECHEIVRIQGEIGEPLSVATCVQANRGHRRCTGQEIERACLGQTALLPQRIEEKCVSVADATNSFGLESSRRLATLAPRTMFLEAARSSLRYSRINPSLAKARASGNRAEPRRILGC